MIKYLIAISFFMTSFTFAFASAETKSKQDIYQTLKDASSFGSCITTNWEYNRRTWYAASFVYAEVQLVKKWLEDSRGEVISGSFENIVEKHGRRKTTEGSHSTDRSALNECNQNIFLYKVGASSREEINSAIERFTKK